MRPRAWVERIVGLATIGAMAATLGLPAAANAAVADPAATQIDGFDSALIETMKDAKALGFTGRYHKLTPVVERTFDIPTMIRFAVGPGWATIPAAQQAALTGAFERLTVASYAHNFDGYSGEHFDVDPNPTPTTGGVIVNTKLVQSSGEPVELNYLMRDGDAGWQILDVFLKGTVSELATRRSEFSTVLRRDGAEALVHLIQNRADDLKKPA